MNLIERIHKADGPTRALDHEIARVLGYTTEVIHVPADHPLFKQGGGLEFMYDARSKPGDPPAKRTAIPPYTASLEAAMTILLDGWEYEISTLYGTASVELPLNDNGIPPIKVNRQDGNVVLAICEAATEARSMDRVEPA